MSLSPYRSIPMRGLVALAVGSLLLTGCAIGTPSFLTDSPREESVSGQGVGNVAQSSGPVWSYDEAIEYCDTLTDDSAWEECVSSAINEWCMFEPLPEDNPHWTEKFDGRCAYIQAQQN